LLTTSNDESLATTKLLLSLLGVWRARFRGPRQNGCAKHPQSLLFFHPPDELTGSEGEARRVARVAKGI
jgi:hypothetical protein